MAINKRCVKDGKFSFESIFCLLSISMTKNVKVRKRTDKNIKSEGMVMNLSLGDLDFNIYLF